MASFQTFVFLTISFVLIASAFLSFKMRKKLKHSYSMMIPMSLGTNIGLTIGILFGAAFSGNLFQSTLISVVIGMTGGIVSAIGFGIMGWLEGFMAGIMGAMMGAMLGAMITAAQAETMVNIFLTLTVSSLLLYLIVPHIPDNDSTIRSKKWFLKPIFTLLLVAFYLLYGAQTSNKPFMPDSKSKTTVEMQHPSSQK
ncbi:hypothetical protein ACQYAD_11095 [Neobacillus sp. SM06]|uniref:hypothetical protein n=1 Tax=Neobacillus sp. SM06 TaxID=3422492 RepID=UPI003D2D4004